MSTTPNKATRAAHVPFRKATIEQPIETVKNGLVRYGKDNLYPQTLWGYYYDSPIHGGIVNQKQIFVFGDGVEVAGTMAAQNDQIQANEGSKFTLDEVVDSVALDQEVQEYFYLLFKKQPTGIWAVSTLAPELMRPDENFVEFEYSENWGVSSQSFEKTGHRVYPSIFHISDLDESCVMYVKTPAKQVKVGGKGKKLTTSTFPIPKYNGAINSIVADIQMNKFHLSEVVNGWKNNTIINMNNGVPDSDKEADRIVDEITAELTDIENNGGVTVVFNDGTNRAVTVENLNGNNNDTRYLLTQEHLKEQIMIAHSVQSPELFAVLITGRLGGNTNLEEDFNRFMGTYVASRRKTISDAIEEGFGLLNGWLDIDIVWRDWMPNWIGAQVDGDNKVAEAINSMSPLVATKLLDNLTINEIRALGSLPPIADGDRIKSVMPEGQPAPDADDVINSFVAYGQDRKGLRVLHSSGFNADPQDDSKFVAEYLSQKFNVSLSDEQNKILQLINEGESFAAIVAAIGGGASLVGSNVLFLIKQGLVETTDDGWQVTDQGMESISTEEMISVLYTYEKRPEVSGPDILPNGRTRSFCENLIALNRAYTREEIDQISAAVGRDVWFYKGGWYHNPNTNKNESSCRHFWKQNIVLS
jgi:hypothetical protein